MLSNRPCPAFLMRFHPLGLLLSASLADTAPAREIGTGIRN
jgi:hypothetical protein